MTYMRVSATVADYDAWKADFDSYRETRAEHGGRNYQLFRASDDTDRITVLIEFDDESSARGWNEYLRNEGELREPEMADVEVTCLDIVEHVRLPTPQ